MKEQESPWIGIEMKVTSSLVDCSTFSSPRNFVSTGRRDYRVKAVHATGGEQIEFSFETPLPPDDGRFFSGDPDCPDAFWWREKLIRIRREDHPQ